MVLLPFFSFLNDDGTHPISTHIFRPKLLFFMAWSLLVRGLHNQKKKTMVSIFYFIIYVKMPVI